MDLKAKLAELKAKAATQPQSGASSLPDTNTVSTVESAGLQADPVDFIRNRITALQSAIHAAHPTMPHLLREIRATLKSNPATVTLLNERDIAIIVQGLEAHTRTYIAQAITKPSASKTKALKNVTASDLGL